MKTECDLPLRLRPSRVRRPAEAWLLVGESPESWVEILLAYGCDLDACEGFLLPRSGKDRRPYGWLITAGAETLSGVRDSAARGYRRVHGRCLIPCEAELFPQPSVNEMESLIPFALVVWHPGIGVVGFEEEDRVSVADLIQPWQERETHFSWAHPGITLQEELRSIQSEPVKHLQVLWEGGETEEVGTQSPASLPPAPGEPGENAIQRLRRRMRLKVLHAMNSLASGEGKPGEWRARLEAWTRERMDALTRDQERELKRLLHLLQTRPEEGLKYAPPMVDGPPAPGSGPPAAKLPPRETEFRMERLERPVTPGAPWVIDWDRRYQLTRQYREVANRELRLGHHRRAAYIFAELLKDYREAASVLRQGKHYREAALLYIKHVGDPLEGGRCLREGGYLEEAIPVFEKLKLYATVAELHEALGNLPEAERAHRLTVKHFLTHGQNAQAATYLFQHLGEAEEALALLQRAWPGAPDAEACLSEEWKLLDRLKEEERLILRMREVVGDHPRSHHVSLLNLLVAQARQNDSPEVRREAEHGAFQVAARWLNDDREGGKRKLLEGLQRLVPEDRLFLRDAHRYRDASERRNRERQSRMVSLPAKTIVAAIESRPLPTWVEWRAVVPRGEEGCMALGQASVGPMLMRYRWDGGYQTQRLPELQLPSDPARYGFEVAPQALPERVSLVGLRVAVPVELPPTESFASALRVENPSWVEGASFLGMAYGGHGVAWVLRQEEGLGGDEQGWLALSSHSSMGDLIATHTLRLPPAVLAQGSLRAPVRMIHACEQVVFLQGRFLCRFYRDRLETLALEAEPRRLQWGAVNGQLRLVATFDEGVEILRGNHRWGQRAWVDLPLEDAVVTFTRTGELVAVSSQHLDLLADRGQGMELVHREMIDPLEKPLGVFRTETPHRYVVVGSKEARHYHVNAMQAVQKR